MYYFRIMLALVLCCAPCDLSMVAADDQLVPKIDVELLIKAWTHSREEDEGVEGKVFRLSNSKTFPPSRFRQKYQFNKDGTCKVLYLHPSDAHRMVAGKWTIDDDNPRVINIDCPKSGKKTLEVLELTDKLLRVK